MNYPFSEKWQFRFLLLARHIASWSKDPSSSVGAVIVNSRKQIVSLGYNGFPRGIEDDPSELSSRELKYKKIVHAEANAILNSPYLPLSETHLFVFPFPPCCLCAGLIIQAGISSVTFPDWEIPERWKENFELAKEMLSKAGLKLYTLSLPPTFQTIPRLEFKETPSPQKEIGSLDFGLEK